ncbi:MAG: ribonuclease HII [Alphaproteobacteria bacterium]|nr:ribonuclease HII [Alphaproteobacteria bacterium]
MAVEELVCGIDEAGRGPLAGPVCAAAVILAVKPKIRGLNDSKLLTEAQRDSLAVKIKVRAVAWGVGWASAAEIDQLNIRQANFLAMQRAYDAMCAMAAVAGAPALALVDGNDPPPLPCAVRTIVGGDGLEPAISAASILAKTARDALMVELCGRYPGYGFSKHKGYGVPQHLAALRELGPCPEHRMTFAPVRACVTAA